MRPLRPWLVDLAALAPIAWLAACGWSKPAAHPENADDSESSEESANTDSPKKEPDLPPPSDTPVSSGPAPATKATVKDDPERAATPCKGDSIGDLLGALSQASCELPPNAPAPQPRAAKDNLDVKASTDAKIPPGSTANIRVVFTNKAKEPMALDFTIDPDPHFQFELYTLKGSRVDRPAGAEPALPAEVADAPAVDTKTARVTIGPRGSATLILPWQAVRYRWASKEKAKGALPGHGYPREPAGPLPKGKYVLHVICPITDTDETSGHELSDARVNIEIAGSAQAAAPAPAPAPAPRPVAKKAAPAAGPAPKQPEMSIEQKFLKATGGSTSPAPSTKKQ